MLDSLHLRSPSIETALRSASRTISRDLSERYSALNDEYLVLGGYQLDSRLESVINGLDFPSTHLDTPVHALSGGTKTKLSLARLLLSDARLLLLDEPTNFLDLRALLWLENFVNGSDRSYLIVSHDRRFLDRTVESILEIDAREHTVQRWAGNYSAYAEAKRTREQKEWAAYRDQQSEIARIERDIRNTKDQARGVEAHTKSGAGADHQRRVAKKVARKAKTRERRLQRQMDAHRIEKPQQTWGLQLVDMSGLPAPASQSVLQLTDLRANYGAREVLRGVQLTVFGTERIALLGENGSGKSTLLRCIRGKLPYEGSIRLGASVVPGLLSQEHEDLDVQSPVLEVFRQRTGMHEREARTQLHKYLFAGDDVFKPIGALSYGQRSKLALAILLLSGCNFLLLDEPTAHMDIVALSAVEDAVALYRGPMIVVSHDRHFLDHIGVSRVVELSDGTLHDVDSLRSYEQSLSPG